MVLNEAEKIDVLCPECGAKNEVLWVPAFQRLIKVSGTAGISGNKFIGKREKVRGKCKCGYTFKADDLE